MFKKVIYNIVNKSKGKPICNKAELANNYFSRLMGLMFRKSLGNDECLAFYNAPSIHTCFMRFPLDLVFIDKDKKVIKICEGIKPWRFVISRGSYLTLEFSPNKISTENIELGDILELFPHNTSKV